MLTNEDLLAISVLLDKTLDKKLKPIKLTLENDVIPRLQNIESCYTSTYKRYVDSVELIDTMQEDIKVIKDVLMEHSEKLKKIS